MVRVAVQTFVVQLFGLFECVGVLVGGADAMQRGCQVVIGIGVVRVVLLHRDAPDGACGKKSVDRGSCP